VTSQIVDMVKREKVPSVLVLILQTVNEFQKTLSVDDPALAKQARELYSSLQKHQDTDVAFYAEQFASPS